MARWLSRGRLGTDSSSMLAPLTMQRESEGKGFCLSGWRPIRHSTLRLERAVSFLRSNSRNSLLRSSIVYISTSPAAHSWTVTHCSLSHTYAYIVLIFQDDFFVLGCDGLYDVLTAQQIINFIKRRLEFARILNPVTSSSVGEGPADSDPVTNKEKTDEAEMTEEINGEIQEVKQSGQASSPVDCDEHGEGAGELEGGKASSDQISSISRLGEYRTNWDELSTVASDLARSVDTTPIESTHSIR